MGNLPPIEPRHLGDQENQPRNPDYPPPGYERPTRSDYNRPDNLGNINAPDLRRRVPVDEIAREAPRPPAPPRVSFSERQVEALGWGIAVIVLGIAILLFFTNSPEFLITGFPIIGGTILLLTSLYQNLRGWPVSLVTWLTAIILVAFSITRFVALVDGEETGVVRSVAYFIGVSIIIAGFIVLTRIFRRR